MGALAAARRPDEGTFPVVAAVALTAGAVAAGGRYRMAHHRTTGEAEEPDESRLRARGRAVLDDVLGKL
ncbi:hypothetical protein [Lentzea sp. NPDC003310]|uniref:hypothetical protein n=1 Tax=Lentzea sp. NPDC003310 TaxID=3154447 RepID=UPI0033BD82FB